MALKPKHIPTYVKYIRILADIRRRLEIQKNDGSNRTEHTEPEELRS